MAKSPKKSRVLAEFSVPMKVEIREPDFEPLASLAALDLKRLQKGNTRSRLGSSKAAAAANWFAPSSRTAW